ncbi:hypothetical protein EP331_07825 [bacterium]|nr:MAG: hypothetical protein EP331_07825 [bacterium]
MKNNTNVSFITPEQFKQSAMQLTQMNMGQSVQNNWHQQTLIDSIRQGIESSIYAGRKKYTVLIVEEEF